MAKCLRCGADNEWIEPIQGPVKTPALVRVATKAALTLDRIAATHIRVIGGVNIGRLAQALRREANKEGAPK